MNDIGIAKTIYLSQKRVFYLVSEQDSHYSEFDLVYT